MKSLLAERDETIASLTEEKNAAETEAAIEAEVGKRLAERMAEILLKLAEFPTNLHQPAVHSVLKTLN